MSPLEKPPPLPDIDVNALMRGLVHELRNPLSAILTASSLLQPGLELDEESAMLLDVVQKESRRMNRILTEFSSFVKPPAPHPEVFDLTALLRGLLRDLQKEDVLNAQIIIQDDLAPSLDVRGDTVQTRQALHHVLYNAAEAMEGSGTLHLASVVEGPRTWVCIEDSGEGLRDNAIERAFQPFFSTKPASTGLGLSIARGLLRAFEGDLMLENLAQNKHRPQNAHGGLRVKIILPTASTDS